MRLGLLATPEVRPLPTEALARHVNIGQNNQHSGLVHPQKRHGLIARESKVESQLAATNFTPKPLLKQVAHIGFVVNNQRICMIYFSDIGLHQG